MNSQSITFFSSLDKREKKQVIEIKHLRHCVLSQVDFNAFHQQSLELIQQYFGEQAYQQWKLFCEHLSDFSKEKTEQMVLMKAAFNCLEHPVQESELAQLITLVRHLMNVDGSRLFHQLFTKIVPTAECKLSTYLRICQLLIDMHDQPGLSNLLKKNMPNLSQVLKELQLKQQDYLEKKFPDSDIDKTIARFHQDEMVQFPLHETELEQIKKDYLAIREIGKTLRECTPEELKKSLHANGSVWRKSKNSAAAAKYQMIAILSEMMRRHFNIVAYPTQILSLLALINIPEKLKGRIAQIRTGEGKSKIIAMLSGFMACQGYFVDNVTSSSNLAIRDCNEYKPYFESLGLTVSEITARKPELHHFNANILYGTNTDFEFAYLRDGLYQEFIPRLFEVVIVDEVDNLFLDVALSSAQMGMQDNSDISWIYMPILEFARNKNNIEITEQLVIDLRQALLHHLKNASQKYKNQLNKFTNPQLNRWLQSANTALYVKKRNVDYRVKLMENKEDKNAAPKPTIVIMDYENTGRSNEGCQWQNGLHQFTQLKEGVELETPIKTGASISHRTYFNFYQHIFGLTGTMGEVIERKEVERDYLVESFDVPPQRLGHRIHMNDYLFKDKKEKWAYLLEELDLLRRKAQPCLILFKTIDESNAFSQFLKENGFKHQLLNETQREAEEYIIDQAGEPGVITIATNTAGRGTDIRLSAQSLEAGGLRMYFTFYPNNLRVQTQGAGRAGRQGQPGAWSMMLDLEDEMISAFLRENTSKQKMLKKQIDIYFLKQHNTRKLSPGKYVAAASVIELLDEMRTIKIQQESQHRSLSSDREKMVFEKLQHFFAQMRAVHALSKTQNFRQSLIDFCQENKYRNENSFPTEKNFSNEEDCYIEQDDADWVFIREKLELLLKQKNHVSAPVWEGFIDQFNKIYLKHIRNLWGTYYSRLKDVIENEQNKEQARKAVYSFLNQPSEMAKAVLNKMMTPELHCEDICDNNDNRNNHSHYTSEDHEPNPDNHNNAIILSRLSNTCK